METRSSITRHSLETEPRPLDRVQRLTGTRPRNFRFNFNSALRANETRRIFEIPSPAALFRRGRKKGRRFETSRVPNSIPTWLSREEERGH